MQSKKQQKGGGVTDKKVPNAGSGDFNQGSAQDPEYQDDVADGPEHPEKISKERQNPKTRITKEKNK